MSANLDAALSYAALGRQVFPLQWPVSGKCSCRRTDCTSPAKHPRTEHGLNDATTDEGTIREWWQEHPEANVGLRMGDGLIAIDVDPRKGGDESIRDLGDLPDTVTALTGGGGSHLIYHADEEYRNGADIAPGVDVRSKGGYIVAPPSRHVSGRLYEWEMGHAPREMRPAPLPDVFKKLLQNGRSAPMIGDKIPAGGRNQALASLAGSMRRPGMDEDEIAAALLEVNAKRCDPPLPEHEVRAIAASVSRYEPDTRVTERPAGGNIETPELQFDIHETDLGNSLRLVRRHGKDLRHCHPQGRWYVWDSTRWEGDDTGAVRRLAKDTVRAIYAEASEAEDSDRRKRLSRHAQGSEAEARVIAMISLARSDLPVLPEQLDADPWLLNVANGTIDLHTGRLREHRQGDLITKLAPVTFDPAAKAPVFATFMDKIMDGNAAMIGYLRRAIGYSLSGDVSEQALFFQHGGGSNGKSTLSETVQALTGDYGRQAAPGLLTTKRGERHPTELADLFGARFVSSVEVAEGRALDEERLKALTGGEPVKGRRMREDFREFAPTHKLWLSANHKPTVRGSDHAIWRRIKLIPFNVTIADSEQDRHLKDKLRAELPGILNWALEGCLEWQRDGLSPPQEVTGATADYREEMDVIAPFLEDRCILGEGERATATALYNAYRQWCEAGGEKAMTKTKLGIRLSDHGFTKERDAEGRSWVGVGLVKVSS